MSPFSTFQGPLAQDSLVERQKLALPGDAGRHLGLQGGLGVYVLDQVGAESADFEV